MSSGFPFRTELMPSQGHAERLAQVTNLGTSLMRERDVTE
jgi:hypothetical protein